MATVDATGSAQQILNSLARTESTSKTEDNGQSRFLTLLTTQLKNQDPLNPLDNAEVTSQLAQQYDCDGSYGYVSYDLIGDTGTSCSSPANWCESTVCADLHIRGRFECFFVPTGCDYYNPYGC